MLFRREEKLGASQRRFILPSTWKSPLETSRFEHCNAQASGDRLAAHVISPTVMHQNVTSASVSAYIVAHHVSAKPHGPLATDSVSRFTRLGRDAAITTLLDTPLLLLLKVLFQRLELSSE